MLTNIENRLEELFEQIEMMPQDRVEAAEKVSAVHFNHITVIKYFSSLLLEIGWKSYFVKNVVSIYC